MDEDQPKRVYGGQAVLEGVMMRGPDCWSVAVRRPGGDIWLERHDLEDVSGRPRWKRLPLVRGVFALGDSLSVGLRALAVSARHAEGDDEDRPPRVGLSALIALVTFAVVFVVAPSATVKGLDDFVFGGRIGDGAAFHLIEQSISITLFVLYIAATARLPGIRRTFEYHGAEHMTISAWEAGVPLEPDNVEQHSTFHPRCGTNFLILVMLLSMFAWTVGGLFVRPPAMAGFLGALSYHVTLRVALLPVVAGVAYEFLKLGASHGHNPLVRAIVTPGLALQRITTRPPDRDQVEVAIRSFEAVAPLSDLNGRAPRSLPSTVTFGGDDTRVPLTAAVTQIEADTAS